MAQKRLKMWGVMGGLQLIHCHAALGQCAIENILKGEFLNFLTITGVRKPWYTDGKYGSRTEVLAPITMADGTLPINTVSLQAKTGYALTPFVRTSHNDGYLGFRGGGPRKPVQTKFGPQTDFRTMRECSDVDTNPA